MTKAPTPTEKIQKATWQHKKTPPRTSIPQRFNKFNVTILMHHKLFATGAACQQRTLTPPDTWSCPTLRLASVLMLRQISPELVLSPDFWVSNIPRYFCFSLWLHHSRGTDITSSARVQFPYTNILYQHSVSKADTKDWVSIVYMEQ